MEPHATAVINEVIHKLQGLMGGKSTASGPRQATIPQFDANLAKFVDFSKSQSPEIQQLTCVFTNAAHYMKMILGYSAACKKYNPDQEKQLQGKFHALSQRTVDIETKHRDYIDHAKAVRELLSATFWVFVPTPEFIIKGAIQSADFNAIRFMKRKDQGHIDWWKLLQNTVKSLKDYVTENYPTGLSYQGKDDRWGDIISGDGSSKPTKAEPSKPAPSHHHEEKKEVAPTKKAPRKEMVGLSLEITNFQGQNLEVQENELQMKHGVYIEKCAKSLIKVHPKVKSVVLNKCQHVSLVAWNCVSGIELMNCRDVKIYVKEKTPSISIDDSKDIKVVLSDAHLGTDIVSSKSSQLVVCHENAQGNESKAYTIGEQMITKWDPQSKNFKTGLYDAFL